MWFFVVAVASLMGSSSKEPKPRKQPKKIASIVVDEIILPTATHLKCSTTPRNAVFQLNCVVFETVLSFFFL